MDFDEAFWDDGEWVTWDSVDTHLARLELQHRFPKADVELIPIFEDLKQVAQDYHFLTGSHLQVYGDLGELFGAIQFGIKLHRNYAEGSDGRLGDDFIEIKTITPFKQNDVVTLKLDRHFSKILVVKITEDFKFAGRLVDRRAVAHGSEGVLRLAWSDIS